MRKEKRRKNINEIIQEALEDAPTIQGYTIKQLTEITGIPWHDSRWHLERCGRDFGEVTPYEIGRAKIYKPKKAGQYG